MDTTRKSTLHELAEPIEAVLAAMPDAAVVAAIDTERAEGRAFGFVAEACRHELARRTMQAAQ